MSRRSVRYYLYRPEVLEMPEDVLRRVDWEADADLSALINLAVRLLGGSMKPNVYSLPVLVPAPGYTETRRALVLRVGGPTAIFSPVRLHAFRRYLAFSIAMHSSDAEGDDTFAGRVASQARDVAGKLTRATYEMQQ